ncbi:MAG TPA: hypothetical protein VGL08_06735 [Paraburkholderia sp.]
MNQRQFAELHHVTPKTVTKWKERGWLVFTVEGIDVRKSNALLRKFRRTKSDSKSDLLQANNTYGDDDSGMSYDEAHRRKEIALSRLRELQVEQASGELVELAIAERVLFDCARSQRDAWLNWPTRYGPLISSDLNVELDLVVDTLTRYVYAQLAEFAEPRADFGGPDDHHGGH